jgi:hypothetical protein
VSLRLSLGRIQVNGAISIFCGFITGGYIYANFELPKNNSHTGEDVILLMSAPDTSNEVKTLVVNFAACTRLATNNSSSFADKEATLLMPTAMGMGVTLKFFYRTFVA